MTISRSGPVATCPGSGPAVRPPCGDAERWLRAPLRGARQADHEARPAAVGIGGLDAAAVRVHDLGDDREPQPGAATSAPAPALGAPEALEEPARVTGREARPPIANLDDDRVAVRPDVHLDRRRAGR